MRVSLLLLSGFIGTLWCPGLASVFAQEAEAGATAPAQVESAADPKASEVSHAAQGRRLDEMSARLLGSLPEGEAGASNPAFSPVAFAAALEALWQGSAGNTTNEIAAILGFPDGDSSALNEQSSTWKWLTTEKPAKDWKFDHALWYHEKHPLRSSYLDKFKKAPSLNIKALDFAQPESGKAVGKWASDLTKGKIQQPVPPAALNELTRLVWVSLMNYKARWMEPLNPADTKPGPFQTVNGTVETSIMHGKLQAAVYPGGKGWQLIYLAMDQDASTAIEIRLPEKVLSTKELAALLTEPARALPPEDYEAMPVLLPRIDSQSTLAWTPVLEKLGAKDLLTEADFSKASEQGGLRLTDLSTVTLLKMDEEGAAVSSSAAAVVTARGSAPRPINVDRPFVWVVRHKSSGLPLAVGIYEKPAKSQASDAAQPSTPATTPENAEAPGSESVPTENQKPDSPVK